MTGYVVRRTIWADNRIGQSREYLTVKGEFGTRENRRVFDSKQVAEYWAGQLGGEVIGYADPNEPIPGLDE